jgi:hypothetical protein
VAWSPDCAAAHVVDTELKDGLDTAALQRGQEAFTAHRHVDAAVAVGRHRELARSVEHQLALGRKAWQQALLKKDHAVRTEAKVVVRGEEAARLGVGRARGHHEQRQPHHRLGHTRVSGGEAAHLEHLLGVVLEEALARGQPDVVATLGRARAEARALSTRQQQGGHLAACDHREPTRLQRLDLAGRQVCERHDSREGLAFHGALLCTGERRLEHARDRLQVDRAQLREKGVALIRRRRRR